VHVFLFLIITAFLLASGEDVDLCTAGCLGIKCTQDLRVQIHYYFFTALTDSVEV